MKVDILLVDSATACACSSCFTPHLAEKGYIIDRRPDIYSCMEALTHREREYGLVIVHMNMLPKALRVVRKIREQNATIPIIVITFINRGPTDIDAIYKAGANDFVVKPTCGPAFLEMTIKHYISPTVVEIDPEKT